MQQAERIGKYQILKVLGKGAAGQVFLAQQDQVERHVALKVLLPNVVETKPHFLERFYREARLIARLYHPNIIAVFELGKVEVEGLELHYYTMEFVDEAESLHDLIQRGGELTFDQKVDVMEQLLDALALAHREGVVHRDLKPMNVLMDSEGTPKILDFGVSKSYDDEDLTVAGMIIGSPPYMSPEQARAQKVTVKSDVFSFGVMMYEMFGGRRPFLAGSRKEYILDRQKYPRLPKEKLAPPLRNLEAGFPRELDEMIHSMLIADPERRPSAQRLREQLGHWRKAQRRERLVRELVAAGEMRLPPEYWSHWQLPAAVAGGIFVVGALLELVI